MLKQISPDHDNPTQAPLRNMKSLIDRRGVMARLRLKLRTRLVLILLAFGLIPAAVIGGTVLWKEEN